jgi:hypothetical protein
MPYLGSDEFGAWAYGQRTTDDEAVSRRESAAFRPSMDQGIERVVSVFDVNRESIVHTTRGGTNNVPRWVAM